MLAGGEHRKALACGCCSYDQGRSKIDQKCRWGADRACIDVRAGLVVCAGRLSLQAKRLCMTRHSVRCLSRASVQAAWHGNERAGEALLAPTFGFRARCRSSGSRPVLRGAARRRCPEQGGGQPRAASAPSEAGGWNRPCRTPEARRIQKFRSWSRVFCERATLRNACRSINIKDFRGLSFELTQHRKAQRRNLI